MKLRSLVLVVGMALGSVAVHAQTGLYINPIAIRVSNSVADHGLYAFLGQDSTAATFWGVNIGGYYDFKTPYPFKAGIDIRDSVLYANGAKLNNFLFGVRISGKPFGASLKPYIEPVVGVGTSRAPYTAIHLNKVEYGVYGGLDYETHHHIDFRLVEAGYSQLITASSETIGGVSVIPSSNLITVSTGFVLRFP